MARRRASRTDDGVLIMHIYIRPNETVPAMWCEIEAADLEYMYCCDCGEPAERIVQAGPRYAPRSVLWGMCRDCAFESRAESITAERSA